MVNAVMMSQDQIKELAELARADPVLWTDFKNRELEGSQRDPNADDDPKLPSMAMIAREITNRYHGPEPPL